MIIFKLHSISSAITNSSTTLYVLDTERTVEYIQDIVAQIVEIYDSVIDSESNCYQIYQMNGKDIKSHDEWKWYMTTFDLDKQQHTDTIDSWYDENIKNDEQYIIFIENDDNIMPYALMEFIGNIFNGIHIHLG